MNEKSVIQRIACKAVIRLNDRVLLLREGSTYEEGTQLNRWGFPGGRVNPGEPYLEGLRREVKEETGLEIAVQEPIYVGEWFPVIKGQQNQIVAIFFACETKRGTKATDVRLSGEHDTYQWVTQEESKALDVLSPHDDVIVKFFTRT